VRRNPYLQDDLLDSPRRLNMLVEAMRHRLAEIDKRRGDKPAPDRVTELIEAGAPPWTHSRTNSRKRAASGAVMRGSLRSRAGQRALRRHARVSHVTDATDWRVEYPFVVGIPIRRRSAARSCAR
jgi:hypothetical protein